ncbi:A24 family peptidase [Edwardsiella tarda]|uniref:prepilin peptidase n=1 Tax=Edwardsiella tarda TaxID=636 RepID=UPI001FA80436|nr:A24 family peptidase [Edwardsiella tarda]UCQ26590.1 A24 family peptidase [Edwardsiella tarda]
MLLSYFSAFLGLIIGSFLNVVIWRYPIMLRQQMTEFQDGIAQTQSGINLMRPRSHCPHCRKVIRMRDNIPLLSWVLLKGRCRDCHVKITWRYPLVELLTALSFLLASLVWPASGWGLAVMVLSAWLIAASSIDLEHQWLPDIFTQGVLWTGLMVAWSQQGPLSLHDAVTGVLAGFTTFYTLRWLASVILHKEALGMGDVLLFAGLGSWTGPVLLPDMALMASCCGLIYAAITGKKSTALPFGPCLSLGGMMTLYAQALL